MMANISERDQTVLRFGGIGVGLILAVVFVLFPIMNLWDSRAEQIEAAKKKILAIQSGVQDAADASNSTRTLRTRATMYPNRLALNQQTARTLQRVQALPGYGTLSVRRLEGMPLRDEGKFFRSGVTLQFGSTLGDLHSFLTSLEGAEPALKVERLNLTLNQKDPSRIEGQLVINGFAVVTEERKRG
jgi:hypothetical protein